MAKLTFEQIRKLADQLDMSEYKGLGQRVDNELDRARGNADDTVYLEKANADWNDVALASLESCLAYSSDQAVLDWFAGIGFTW